MLPTRQPGFARCGVRGRAPPGARGKLLPGGSRGFAKGGTEHPDLRPGFLYPLLRLPLTFRSAAQRSFAAKKRGTQLRPVRRSFSFSPTFGAGFALDFRA